MSSCCFFNFFLIIAIKSSANPLSSALLTPFNGPSSEQNTDVSSRNSTPKSFLPDGYSPQSLIYETLGNQTLLKTLSSDSLHGLSFMSPQTPNIRNQTVSLNQPIISDSLMHINVNLGSFSRSDLRTRSLSNASTIPQLSSPRLINFYKEMKNAQDSAHRLQIMRPTLRSAPSSKLGSPTHEELKLKTAQSQTQINFQFQRHVSRIMAENKRLERETPIVHLFGSGDAGFHSPTYGSPASPKFGISWNKQSADDRRGFFASPGVSPRNITRRTVTRSKLRKKSYKGVTDSITGTGTDQSIGVGQSQNYRTAKSRATGTTRQSPVNDHDIILPQHQITTPVLYPQHDPIVQVTSSSELDTEFPHRQHQQNRNVDKKNSLFEQYWWMIVIIAAFVLVLIILSSGLLVYHFRYRMKIRNKVIENKLDQLQTINDVKSSINKIKMRIQSTHSKKSNSFNYPFAKIMECKIETSTSTTAPCSVWLLCGKIGSGRFGEVRLAINPNFKSRDASFTSISFSSNSDINIDNLLEPKYYAVKRAKFSKTLQGGIEPNAEVMSIFHEIMMLSKLEHLNIVKYYGNGIANNKICLFLEWCPIGSMGDVLSVHKPFNIVQIHFYLKQLLTALDYLHSNNIYHRDIKARNILLSSDGLCKLADFGSAVDILDHQKKEKYNHSVSHAGTIHWWPPELFHSKTERYELLSGHDIWSLGVTIIEMITGLPTYHQLSVDLFSIMMKTNPTQYLAEIPTTENMNLNSFLSLCFILEYKKRPSVIQLLQHSFVHSVPSLCLENDNNMNMFLKNRENEAQNYAVSIIKKNLPQWLETVNNIRNNSTSNT